MAQAHLHGYLDPALPALDAGTISELNLHAARDLAKRSIPGGLIILLALLISATAAPIMDDATTLICSLFTVMTVVVLLRLFSIRLLFNQQLDVDKWRWLSQLVFLISASIWGFYVAFSLHLYQNSAIKIW